MDTVIVLKFGGSSMADNLTLNIVAQKIIDFYQKNKKLVVVVSAQGKTTDRLLSEAKELSNLPEERELDVLLSTGEQVSMSKLAILLNRLGYKAVSLTGWQAGIATNDLNQNAKIETIDVTRIQKELEQENIVIVAGFQGINLKGDITTLGRGGSDTTAVAIASALQAKQCYIFSDVDGVYTTDPNKVTTAKKLETLSYEEMLEIANEGAKVLHNRSIEVGQKYHIPIITKSTFNNKAGTIVQDKIEDTKVKSIVKNDDIIYVNMKYETYSLELFHQLLSLLLEHQIAVNHIQNESKHTTNIFFTIKASSLSKFQNLLEEDLSSFDSSYHNVSKIAIVGHGIRNDDTIFKKVMKIVKLNQLEVYHIEVNESKIALLFTQKLPNYILEQLHKELIEE